MWTTTLEFKRPKKFDVVRQKLLNITDESTSIEFRPDGEIAMTFSSRSPSAVEATKNALEKFAFLMMAAKLTLEPQNIQSRPFGVQPTSRLVGAGEIAKILNVSKARVSQLSKSEEFPSPTARLSMGPVYLEQAILKYMKDREETVQRREVAKLQLIKARLQEAEPN